MIEVVSMAFGLVGTTASIGMLAYQAMVDRRDRRVKRRLVEAGMLIAGLVALAWLVRRK